MTEPAPFVYAVTDVPASPGVTPWQTVGPFFHYALPYDSGSSVVGPLREGAFMLRGQVYDGAGDPVPDALLEVWQADERGSFADQPGIYAPPAEDGFRGFGRCATDEEGRWSFTTVKPAGVPAADGAEQAPHLALSVFARGMLRRAVTRVYFDGESANDADPLLSSLAPERAATMLARAVDDGYVLDVRVQGDDETVFLDVAGH